ncbi:unnamed protein product [Symbiodinium natans]|uniref:PDZ domain-containing protein n=1 Tax=Symbiodinium natans TaxID=878477 RepID=A0A812UQB3_9DINO|nr:unnamed protein product [Symbiodinium natans]
MPPGRIEVKGVAEGLFGSTSGVKEGDVLVEVGTDDLQPLENMSTETFKGFLKDRPLMMKFVAAAAATASGGSAYAADPPKPVEQDASTDAVYSIVAGPDVAKLGITFNGMPPGRIDVKGVAAGSFGSESGVREGDALIEVGKDEFLPLEGMTSETFKSLLKDRPLRMKFQATSAVAHADAPTPAEDHAAPAPQGTANSVEAAKEAVSHPLLESGEYTVVASSEVGKLGISFHGMPPGRIEVKGVAEGLFGSTSGVKEGDVLVEVGTDDLQPLENMSTDTFKGFLKDRPLMMRFSFRKVDSKDVQIEMNLSPEPGTLDEVPSAAASLQEEKPTEPRHFAGAEEEKPIEPHHAAEAEEEKPIETHHAAEAEEDKPAEPRRATEAEGRKPTEPHLADGEVASPAASHQDRQQEKLTELHHVAEAEEEKPTEPHHVAEAEEEKPIETHHAAEAEEDKPAEPCRATEAEGQKPTEPHLADGEVASPATSHQDRQQEKPAELHHVAEAKEEKPIEPHHAAEAEEDKPAEPHHAAEVEGQKPTEPKTPRNCTALQRSQAEKPAELHHVAEAEEEKPIEPHHAAEAEEDKPAEPHQAAEAEGQKPTEPHLADGEVASPAASHQDRQEEKPTEPHHVAEAEEEKPIEPHHAAEAEEDKPAEPHRATEAEGQKPTEPHLADGEVASPATSHQDRQQEKPAELHHVAEAKEEKPIEPHHAAEAEEDKPAEPHHAAEVEGQKPTEPHLADGEVASPAASHQDRQQEKPTELHHVAEAEEEKPIEPHHAAEAEEDKPAEPHRATEAEGQKPTEPHLADGEVASPAASHQDRQEEKPAEPHHVAEAEEEKPIEPHHAAEAEEDKPAEPHHATEAEGQKPTELHLADGEVASPAASHQDRQEEKPAEPHHVAEAEEEKTIETHLADAASPTASHQEEKPAEPHHVPKAEEEEAAAVDDGSSKESVRQQDCLQEGTRQPLPHKEMANALTPLQAEAVANCQVCVVAELCGELEEAQRQAAEAKAALVKEQEVAGAAAQTMWELQARLNEAAQEKEQLHTEFQTEQLLRKRVATELQIKTALASPEVGQVVRLQRELSKSEHALRGMQRRQLQEKDVQSSQSNAESRLLRVEYKAELAAAKRYERDAARPLPPPERTPLERAEAAAVPSHGSWHAAAGNGRGQSGSWNVQNSLEEVIP